MPSFKSSDKPSDHAFMPAVLEVLESPPSPLSRAVTLSLIGLAVLMVLWAFFSEMEIVVSAQGRVAPSGKVKQIQAFNAGIVRDIHVRDGQRVRKGDVLIELDSTRTEADNQRLYHEREEARLTMLRLQAQLQDDETAFILPADTNREIASMQKRLLASRLQQQRSRLLVLESETQEKEAEVLALTSMTQRLAEAFPLIERKHRKHKELAKKGYVSEMENLSTRLEMLAARRELEVRRHRLQVAKSALAASKKEKQRTESEFLNNTLDDYLTARNQHEMLQQEIIKSEQQKSQQKIIAPVDGIVQQLSINTLGGVVTAAQVLLEIVPDDSKLEVNAEILNRDIGALYAGLPVKLKVDAFEFTRHGMIDATLEWVGTNSFQDKQLGMVYPLRIGIETTQLPNRINGRRGHLAPGMSVTADIVVGKRRVIDYFLGPLLRYRDESLRER